MSRWISNSKRRIQKATERNLIKQHQSSMMMTEDDPLDHHHHQHQQLTHSNHHRRNMVEVTIHSVNVPPPPASATDSRNMIKLHSNPTKNHSYQTFNNFLKDDHVQEIKRNETCWFVEREDTISSSSWTKRNPSKVGWMNSSIHHDNERTNAHRQTFSKSFSSNNRNKKDSNVSSKKRSSFETMDGDGGGDRGGDAQQPFYKRLKYGKRVSKK